MALRATPFSASSRFELLSQAGEGGAGVVFEVLDRETRARLALKVLRKQDAESIRQLKYEFRVLQDLHHPNLIVPRELLEENGRWFFTMDYVEGENFLAYVRPRETGQLDEARLRSTLGQLANVLCTLHGHHKVHRDIKPSNVLVTRDGRLALLDFGIAQDLVRGSSNDNGELVGSVDYMAPEQALGDVITPAADWYAVGTMLYEALTGRRPFTGNIHEVLETKLQGVCASPDELAPGVPDDLQRLCMELLRPEPEARLDGSEILRRLGLGKGQADTAPLGDAFVGRTEELSTIARAFADSAGEGPVSLLVAGDSGVGKSRLVRAFTEQAARAGALVLRGRCYERESVPYKAVDGIIDDLAQWLGELPDEQVGELLPDQAGLLRKIFPALGMVPAIGKARITQFDVPNPHEMRQRVFELVRGLFAALAGRQRLVLVIDDLQWADADSFALLSDLLRGPDAPRLLLLASIRSGLERSREGAALLARIDRLPGDVRRIALAPLPESDARKLVAELLERTGVSREREAIANAVLRESGGHPLFIDELVRHRVIAGDDRAPARLDDALWERASQLDPSARKLLELVVTAGAPLAQQVIADAAELGFGQLYDAMSSLRAAHFVRTSGAYRNDMVEPYHDRVRESVLSRLEPAALRVHHARLAHALERVDEADPEKLSLHWAGAGEPARAAAYAVEAADMAVAALAFDHAASLYTRASELGHTGPELQVKLAEALVNAGRGAAAARIFLALGSDSSRNDALDLRRRAAEEFLNSGHMDEGTAVMESVLRAISVHAPKSPLGILASIIFRSLLLKLRGLGFRERAAERGYGTRELLRIDCLYSAGIGFVVTDHFRGKEFNLRTLLAALQSGERSRAARSLAVHAVSTALEGVRGFARAMAMHGVLRRMIADLRQPFLEGMTTLVAAYAHHGSGEWPKARDQLRICESLFRDQCVGVSFELGTTRMLLCRAYAWLGDFRELERRAGAILREAEQKGDIYTVINVSSPLSQLALVRDEPAEAERLIAHAWSQISKRGFHVQHMFCLMARGQAWMYAGDPARTRADLSEHWPALKRSMLLKVEAMHLQLLDLRARACVALAASDVGARAALHAEAEGYLRQIERVAAPWSRGLVHMVRAGLDRNDGRHERAVTHLRAAARELSAADMALHLALVQRRLSEELAPGDEAAELRAASDAWLQSQGVANADNMAALLTPGFPNASRAPS